MLDDEKGVLIDDENAELLCELIYSYWPEIISADYGDEIWLNPFWSVNVHSEEGTFDLMYLGLDGDEWELAAAILYEEMEDDVKIILEIQ